MPSMPIYILAVGAPSHREDSTVAGTYLINVEASLTDAQKASAALDCFHEHTAVKNLDDFEFTVYDGHKKLFEADDNPAHTMGRYASFQGVTDDFRP